MWLQINNLYTKIINCTSEERNWISEYLAFDDASSRFAYSGPQKIKLFNILTESFPTGLLPVVKRGAAAPEVNISLELEDLRKLPVDNPVEFPWIRDYQLEAVSTAIVNKRGIIQCPTGSGKGSIWVALTQRLPYKWLYLVHRRELMYQAAERYKSLTGLEAGTIGDGKAILGDSDVLIGVFQTFHHGLINKDPFIKKILETRDCLGIDECHVTSASSFWKLAMNCPAPYRFGFSGTPLARGDKKSILTIAAIGPVIYKIEATKLIKAGILAKPFIRLYECNQESYCPTWQGVYGDLVVRSIIRNNLITQLAKKASKPCLVFVKEIKHGRTLLKKFQKEGINCDFVYGSDDSPQRREAIKSLVRGSIDVLICSVIFQEGIDIPSLASVIIASGGQSIIATLQRIGRGMRNDGGKKTTFEVFDVMDMGNQMMERHARARMKAYVKEGHETTIEKAII